MLLSQLGIFGWKEAGTDAAVLRPGKVTGQFAPVPAAGV